MKLIRFVLAVSFILFAATASFAAKPSLDGKTYHGTIKMGAEAKADPDEFIFKEGTFRSTACDQYGYTSAPYEVKPEGTKSTFTAVTKNKQGAQIQWNGTIAGDKIDGVAKMTTPSGEITNGTFQGTLRR